MEPTLHEFASSILDAFRRSDGRASEKRQEARLVERVAEVYAAIAASDFDRLEEYLTPDIGFEIIGSHGLPSRQAEGVAQVIHDIRLNFQAVKPEKTTVEALVAQGDAVVLIARDFGEIRATRESYYLQFIVHFDFIGDRIFRVREWVVPLAEGDQGPPSA